VDPYAPAGFTPGQKGAGRVGVLDEFISASDKDGPVEAQGQACARLAIGRRVDRLAGKVPQMGAGSVAVQHLLQE
jgi:hypothetical protein